MNTEFSVHITGLGSFIIDASISKVGDQKNDLECEIEIKKVLKFDEETEEYFEYEPEGSELLLLEKQLAVKFFNSLH